MSGVTERARLALKRTLRLVIEEKYGKEADLVLSRTTEYFKDDFRVTHLLVEVTDPQGNVRDYVTSYRSVELQELDCYQKLVNYFWEDRYDPVPKSHSDNSGNEL